ncbi:uncharacterized protein FIBRA_02958 [Fibroporia radiculosa]|uniref:Uncharacterized protein n=1 Tax=Fibroporia radiculosa TaxID=599839 RepID=J4HVQ3_9APHY|nr:uncharacterized protein FIBRA_02958 [Fibroporia radiculosa]CCM00912.1 predicted protein [Fibroporia radiculosa]
MAPSPYAPSPSPSPTAPLVQIIPLFTPSPDGDSALVSLDAHLTLPQYTHYHSVPLQSFQPVYYALNDGSLLTPFYLDHIHIPKLWLFAAGALSVFFLRNTVVALSFIRRSRVKDKTLFYLLLISQLFGLLGSLALVIADFNQSVSCTAIGAAKKVFVQMSCDTMITGILGVKAYRCLANASIVLAFLLAAGAVMMVLLGISVSRYQAVRSIYGICEDVNVDWITSAIILTAFVETAVICLCFLFAIWKSYRTRAEARLNLRMSEEGTVNSSVDGAKQSGESTCIRRGWWDYVPQVQSHSLSAVHTFSLRGVSRTFMSRLRRLWTDDEYPSAIAFQRKSSLPGEYPIPQPPRALVPPSSSDASPRTSRIEPNQSTRTPRSTQWSPLAAIRKSIRYFTRIELFRKMLRDELLYTTFLAVMFLAIAIVMLVGVNKQVFLGSDGWIMLDWVIISLFTMHSFRRVVRRHELEAVLQHPSAWDRILHSDPDYTNVFFARRSRRSKSPQEHAGAQLYSRRSGAPSMQSETSSCSGSEKSDDTPISPHTRLHPPTPRKSSIASTISSHRAAHSLSCDPAQPAFSWDSAIVLPTLPSVPDDNAYTSEDREASSAEGQMDTLYPPIDLADMRSRYDQLSRSFDPRTLLRTYSDRPDLDTDWRRGS